MKKKEEFDEIIKKFSKSSSSRKLLSKKEKEKLDFLLKDQVLTEKEYKKLLKDDDLKIDEKNTISKVKNMRIEDFIKSKLLEIKLNVCEKQEIKNKKSFKDFIGYIKEYFKPIEISKTEYYIKKETVEKINDFVTSDIEVLFEEYKKEKLEALKYTYKILTDIRKKIFEED